MSKKKNKDKMGVYAIINKINGKMYIGSSINLTNRLYSHRYNLRNNSHHNSYLQNAYNKYGEDKFYIKILEYVYDKNLVFDREQYYLDTYRVYETDKGYNISPIAEGGSGERGEEFKRKQVKLKMNKMGKKSGKFKIRTPDGSYYSLPYPAPAQNSIKTENKLRVANVLLDEYECYCNKYWDDPDVKRFLDDIAYYLCDNNKVTEYQKRGFLPRQSELEITSGSEEYINFADLTYDYQVYFDLIDIEVDENGEELIQLHELRYLEGIPVYD